MNKARNQGFLHFYSHAYRDEHQRPVNIAFHVVGTIAGLLWLVLSVTLFSTWWALAFPIVHAVPGLVGHRLFERAEAIGDARIFRTDVPVWWFLVANHMMTARVIWRFVTLDYFRSR
jgi:hypothetical protein